MHNSYVSRNARNFTLLVRQNPRKFYVGIVLVLFTVHDIYISIYQILKNSWKMLYSNSIITIRYGYVQVSFLRGVVLLENHLHYCIS